MEDHTAFTGMNVIMSPDDLPGIGSLVLSTCTLLYLNILRRLAIFFSPNVTVGTTTDKGCSILRSGGGGGGGGRG